MDEFGRNLTYDGFLSSRTMIWTGPSSSSSRFTSAGVGLSAGGFCCIVKLDCCLTKRGSHGGVVGGEVY